MKKPTLSVIIITKNEQHNIANCLQPLVDWANEIIIVDASSDDKTVEICHQYTEKVFVTSDWPGFGPQKNRALEKATGDWVLSLDADEIITAELKTAIKKAISDETYHAYKLHFRHHYCGTPIKHGDWSNDYHLRLFKRNHGKISNAFIHESVIVDGNIGKLHQTVNHFTYENLDEVIDKMNRYSSQGAKQRFDKGRRSTFSYALARGVLTFIRGYFFRAGFLDGKYGFLLALSNSLTFFYTYLKLAALCKNN